MEDVQYWVIGGTLSLCAIAFFFVMVPRYAFLHVGSGKVPPLPKGKVPVAGLQLFDALGVGLFFGIYTMMWFASVGADTEEMELTALLASTQLVFQGFIIGLVAVILCWRVNLVEFMGMRWKRWYLAPILAIPIIMIVYSFTALLMTMGFAEWVAQLQGFETADEAQQDVVKMMKENKDPLLFVVLAIVACVGAPLSEEIVFRGYIYPVVKRFTNIPISIIFNGLLFAAIHGNLAALPTLFFLGVILAAAYELSGSLWLPVAIHAAYNTVSVILMKLMTLYPEWFEEMAEKQAWFVF